MKTKSFFAILTIVIVTSDQLSAQNIKDNTVLKNSEYLNFSYSVGFAGNIKTNGFNTGSKNGYNFSLDVHIHQKQWSVFL